jgi:hypothetical protein
MEPAELAGHWSLSGLEVMIVEEADRLLVVFPEAPPGFENALEPTGADAYVVRGGPFDGAPLEFRSKSHGSVGGVVPISRLDRPAVAPPGSGLTAPSLELTDSEAAGFSAIWKSIEQDPDGGNIEIDGPPHRFVQWLMATDSVIFHGSNRTDIDEFVPQRASMELNDTGGRGNLGAVYGTHDGLWAMFFAITDRSRLRGSIRNGTTRYETPDRTRAVDRYHFSVHHEMLELAPYTTGALYLLPRAAFDRVPFYPGGPLSNEWACHEPIRPLARLTVAPEDFPFLDSIGGHDDGPLLVLDDLGTQVYEGLTSARRTERGFEIVTATDRGVVDRFIDLSRDFYPDVTRVADAVDAGTRIEMTGPPAFLHGLEKRLGPYLEG